MLACSCCCGLALHTVVHRVQPHTRLCTGWRCPQAAAGCPLVVTGAMKPYDIEGYDGAANLQQAVQVIGVRGAG